MPITRFTMTLGGTSRTMICRYSTTSWLIVFQLMETRFRFAASHSQQVMCIEYAFYTVAMWNLKRARKKKRKRINYTVNPVIAVRKCWKLYSNPGGPLCHPRKCSVNAVIAWFAEPEMVYDFTVSLGYSRLGGLGEHLELYSLCFFSDTERASAWGGKKGEWR